MRAPMSWLREIVAIPADQSGRDVAERLIRAGLEVETVEEIGAGVDGPLVVGRVLDVEELTEFKKPIRFCQVDVGEAGGGVRGIICGARNFAAGDLVVIALPGTVLPGGFEIASRQTYGRLSDGMICSEREMGLGDDHDGIMVLPAGAAEPGADAKPLIGVGEEVLDIAITPDRGYALSIRGIAREVAIAYDLEFTDPGQELADLPAPMPDRAPAECATEAPEACDLFTLRTIVGFDPHAASPLWMKQRLIACGMRPVSLAVDVTNYVMLELGQPLHAFDLDKLQGPVRAGRVSAGTRFETSTTSCANSPTMTSSSSMIADRSAWPASWAGWSRRSTTTRPTSRWRPPTSRPRASPGARVATSSPVRPPGASNAVSIGISRRTHPRAERRCCSNTAVATTSV